MDNARKVKLFGDRIEAMRKYGEGQALLRATKSIAELLGIPYYRLFNADKTVMAQSITGMQDQIILSHEPEVPIEEEKKPYCNIAFLNLPEAIPPMKWYAPGQETFTKGEGGWVITGPDGKTEVEGVDYIKTYFSWVTRDCPSCSPLEFTVAKGDDANILTGSSPNRPFWYKSENDDGGLIYEYEGGMVPHYMGYTTGLGIVIPDNPLNHTIYSLSGCQAQILKNGSKWTFSDAGGSYFLWKAYTEWSNVGPTSVTFSRTGLGYMLMQAFIKNKGINLCETDGMIIKVDCCLKVNDERQVSLWWESLSAFQVGGPTCGGQPFMFYGSIKVCEVPEVIGPIYTLLCIGAGANAKSLYMMPGIDGGCLPYEWSVSNSSFNIIPSKPSGESATLSYKQCPNIYNFEEATALCHETFTVTVTDRCGTIDSVTSLTPCELAQTELVIGYTSLTMGCGAKQTLTAGGGYGPYTWSAGGAGSLSVTQGPETEYTAPGSNVDCGNNDSVSVTDCCGNTATVELWVSCSVQGTALRFCDSKVCEPCFRVEEGGTGWGCWSKYVFGMWKYDCAGSLTSETFGDGNGPAPSFECRVATYYGCCCKGGSTCSDDLPCSCTGYCLPACINPNQLCGTLADLRTPAMKAAGCCPINPHTGLPY